MFSASRCYASLHCEKYGHMRTWNIHNVIYKGSKPCSRAFTTFGKQQTMQNNVETQHKHMYSLYIGSLCNVAFPMAHFTCVLTSQVFVEIWMQWSIALRSAFYRGRKHLWIVFSHKLASIFNCLQWLIHYFDFWPHFLCFVKDYH